MTASNLERGENNNNKENTPTCAWAKQNEWCEEKVNWSARHKWNVEESQDNLLFKRLHSCTGSTTEKLACSWDNTAVNATLHYKSCSQNGPFQKCVCTFSSGHKAVWEVRAPSAAEAKRFACSPCLQRLSCLGPGAYFSRNALCLTPSGVSCALWELARCSQGQQASLQQPRQPALQLPISPCSCRWLCANDYATSSVGNYNRKFAGNIRSRKWIIKIYSE